MSWKGGGAEWATSDDDLIGAAVSAALEPVAPMESAWDMPKLSKKLKQYFTTGAQGLEFQGQSLQDLINQYADNVFGTIFQALRDRPWINQADFLGVLDAGVKELFPRPAVTSVSPQRFERIITAAHDRAFEEQRFAPLLWDVVTEIQKDPKARRKVYDAFEAGRKEAATACSTESPDPLKDFVDYWVSSSVARLAADSGSADALLPPGVAVQFVHALVAAGALPLPLTEDQGIPPPDWHAVEGAVRAAYAQAGKGKGKAKGKGKKGPALQWALDGAQEALPPGKVGGKGKMDAGKGKGKYGKEAGKRMHEQTDSWSSKKPRVAGPATNGHYSEVPEQQATARKGHPNCTQEEDCVGQPSCTLFQHIDQGVKGDLYCASCWAVFADVDPSLNAIVYSS